MTVVPSCSLAVHCDFSLLAAQSAKLTAQSDSALCDPMDCSPPGLSVHGDSPGKNTGGGCHALLLRIFPAQGFNPGLLHAGVFFAISVTREAQQYWSGYSIPSPEELPSPGIELGFPALQADFFNHLSYQGSLQVSRPEGK